MRVFLGFGLVVCYVLWIIYRIINRDMRQHKPELYLYSFFVSVWSVIFYLLFF
jgi:hypothetical protein